MNNQQQIEYLNLFRNGSTELRGELFNHYYTSAIRFIEKLDLPSDIKEDLVQEIAIYILDMIDNSEFRSKKNSSLQIHEGIISTIINYLYTVFDYKKEYNGREYKRADTYLRAVRGYRTNVLDILNEIIRFGKRKEDHVMDLSSGDDFMEDIANSSLLIEKYFEFAMTLSFNRRLVFFGRYPIYSGMFKTENELCEVLNTNKQYVSYIAAITKLDFLSYSNVAYLLGCSKEQKIMLVRDRYNKKICSSWGYQVKGYNRYNGEIIE